MTALRRYWPFAAVLMAFSLGLLLRGGSGSAPDGAGPSTTASAPTRWTCAMHPQIILPGNDQQCPICFMDLIPLEEDQGGGLGPGDLRLSEAALALAEVATRPAERRAVARQLRLVGKVAADETRVRSITARVDGRLDRLHVDATGVTVRAGEALAEIYSPRLYTGRAELRAAAAAAAAHPEDPATVATLEAATERLRLLGLTPAQIEEMRHGTEVRDHITVTAPLGGVVVARRATRGDYVRTGDELYAIADLTDVWVTLAAHETDLTWLHPGQAVSFAARAWPGREFTGEILFIDPLLDETSRTVEVRVAVANADGLLKPGMLVSATVAAELVTGDADALPLVIPATAPLLTGTRAVVYVRLPGGGDPVFRGRQVLLGPRAGDWYVVREGLAEGEDVVVRGAFKIDSALQILARPSMMNPAATQDAPDDHRGVEPAEPGAGVAVLAASDCVGAGLDQLLDAYYPLQIALAADDDEAARRAAEALRQRVAAVACADDPPAGAGAAAWRGLQAGLAEIADAVATADGLAARRLAFEPLSDGLWTTLTRFDRGGSRPVRRFHCPMAMDGAGANWLQAEATVANPYYGTSMLRCGSQVDALGGALDDAGEG